MGADTAFTAIESAGVVVRAGKGIISNIDATTTGRVTVGAVAITRSTGFGGSDSTDFVGAHSGSDAEIRIGEGTLGVAIGDKGTVTKTA